MGSEIKPDLMLDTSILIEVFNKNEEIINLIYEKKKEYNLQITPFVYYELLRGCHNGKLGLKREGDVYRVLLQLGINDNNIVPHFDRIHAHNCALIYSRLDKRDRKTSHREIDFLIGSIASFCKKPLFTINQKHVSDIPELIMI